MISDLRARDQKIKVKTVTMHVSMTQRFKCQDVGLAASERMIALHYVMDTFGRI